MLGYGLPCPEVVGGTVNSIGKIKRGVSELSWWFEPRGAVLIAAEAYENHLTTGAV